MKKPRSLGGFGRKLEDTIEQTIKRVERLNKFLTVIVVVELIVLILFL